MPKDITHWAIATAVKENLQEKHITGILHKNYAAFLTGAVAYDIPYYSVGKYSPVLTNKANQLHNPATHHVWEPLINLIQYYALHDNKELPDLILAFLLGCVTHIITDSRYHPFIYYYTGNSYNRDIHQRNKAVFAHRKLEAYLDLYYLKKLTYTGPTCARHIFNQIPYSKLVELLSVLYFGSPNKKVDLAKHCLNTYMKVQAQLNNLFVKSVLKLLGMVNSEAKKHSALFYPKKITPFYYNLFENNRQYRHPVSGERIKLSLADIYTNCIADNLASFYKIGCCKNSIDFMKAITGFPAVSLETGNACSSPASMRYFSDNLSNF